MTQRVLEVRGGGKKRKSSDDSGSTSDVVVAVELEGSDEKPKGRKGGKKAKTKAKTKKKKEDEDEMAGTLAPLEEGDDSDYGKSLVAHAFAASR